MTEQTNTDALRPKQSIDISSIEQVSGTSTTQKVTKSNWVPSDRQEELRVRLEQQEEERREQLRQEFETRPEIVLIRELQKEVASLQKQIKKLTTETK